MGELYTIKGFPDYKITESGDVYSFKVYKSGKKLKPSVRPHAQTVVVLYDQKGERHMLAVSRLVAQTFLSNPNNLPNVVHLNSDRADNRLENLKWANSKDTFLTAVSNKKYKQYKVYDKVESIKKNILGGMTINDAAKKYGVNRATIRWWLLGRRYSKKQLPHPSKPLSATPPIKGKD